MKIGFAQFDPMFGDKEKTLATIERLTARSGADILVFPELAVTGYMFKNQEEIISLSERIPEGKSIRRLVDIAWRYRCVLIVGMAESNDQREGNSEDYYDTTVIIGSSGYIAKCQKMHLFLREREFFFPGNTTPALFQWRGYKIGVGVCYDYMFPEYWRTLALRGADLFCNTANFVYDYGFRMMQARAIENGVWSICTNRIGEERGAIFLGGSEIVDPRGNILKKANDGESVVVIEADLKMSRNKKWNPYNDLIADRRPEMYKPGA